MEKINNFLKLLAEELLSPFVTLGSIVFTYAIALVTFAVAMLFGSLPYIIVGLVIYAVIKYMA